MATNAELVTNAIRNVKAPDNQTKPLWACVMNIFAIGSTLAWNLCVANGFDPDKEIIGHDRCGCCPHYEPDE